uniref:Sortilin 1 n=1 Tax=Calidris pygmaea TaxID=425635 RepID=A0A8C3KJ55_9CHAR
MGARRDEGLKMTMMLWCGTTRRIHVSLDQGDTWNMAQLPSVGHEQFYSILAANDDLVFMHVDEPGDTGFGTIYTSDDRGIVYSKSLERHLYTTTGGETDFTNVTSLRGIYITSVLSEDNSIQSVITFDRGGEWVPLRKPKNTTCDSTARSKDECSLHIHASYSISQKLNVPMAPLSEPNAVGIVIAHGSVGGAISVMSPDVYISDDGGYTWARMLEGPHHYAILDSGGLIVAIEHTSQPVNVLEFSTDEGQCWYKYTFSKEPIFFTGLASEPGARSMNVSVWGFRGNFLSRKWVSYTIDFSQLLSRTCEEKDYTIWLAHSSDPSDPSDGCILGYKEQYRRLRKSSVCQNGRDYAVTKQPSVCPCTLQDFLCDFGYYRPENQSVCVEQPELKGHDLEFCLYGRRELLKTSGYRKIPGDKCSGGESPSREERDMKKKCTSNFLNPSQLVGDGDNRPGGDSDNWPGGDGNNWPGGDGDNRLGGDGDNRGQGVTVTSGQGVTVLLEGGKVLLEGGKVLQKGLARLDMDGMKPTVGGSPWPTVGSCPLGNTKPMGAPGWGRSCWKRSWG